MEVQEKILNLLETMQSDINDRFDKLEGRFDGLEGRVGSIEFNLASVKDSLCNLERQVTIIEIEHGHKLEALFDGYKLLHEGQQEIKSDIKIIKERLDNHEMQINVINHRRKKA
jgi:hypothetical protein